MRQMFKGTTGSVIAHEMRVNSRAAESSLHKLAVDALLGLIVGAAAAREDRKIVVNIGHDGDSESYNVLVKGIKEGVASYNEGKPTGS